MPWATSSPSGALFVPPPLSVPAANLSAPITSITNATRLRVPRGPPVGTSRPSPLRSFALREAHRVRPGCPRGHERWPAPYVDVISFPRRGCSQFHFVGVELAPHVADVGEEPRRRAAAAGVFCSKSTYTARRQPDALLKGVRRLGGEALRQPDGPRLLPSFLRLAPTIAHLLVARVAGRCPAGELWVPSSRIFRSRLVECPDRALVFAVADFSHFSFHSPIGLYGDRCRSHT